ncbi:MAG: TolC family protein [Flavipsychrobacter sp.]|nr:TolC family protein [Flavipsychrobacter sp.]
MLNKQLAKGMCIIFCMCFLNIHILHAQEGPVADTLHLSIKDAEKTFLEKNLSLLAQHYNIQSSQALVEQARKWDNPILNTDQNIYANNHFFQHGTDANGNPQGEVYAQVQQLIKTAGKRGKQINLAKTNVNIAEWQFKETLRNLRASLFKDFYTIAQLQGVADLNKQNMGQLSKLLTGMGAQLQAGNIARKEYLRVEALQVSLQQDMVENAKDLSDAEAELKTMLQVTGDIYIKPIVAEKEDAQLPDLTFMQLLDSAKRYNTDYQSQVYQLQYQKQNYSLQRALSVPDITFGPEFDQAANYAPNYVGLTISLPLPLWDRNQGNIKSSRFQMKQEETNMQQVDQKLQNDVMNVYQKLLLTAKLSSEQNNTFYKDYYQLYDNILKSYDQRQISLLEFLDYFNDYEDIRQKQLQQTLNLRLAKEDLNDMVGVDVVN